MDCRAAIVAQFDFTRTAIYRGRDESVAGTRVSFVRSSCEYGDGDRMAPAVAPKCRLIFINASVPELPSDRACHWHKGEDNAYTPYGGGKLGSSGDDRCVTRMGKMGMHGQKFCELLGSQLQ
jgi:hypothetical protein